jgi:LmbE family N-acetylglucosaminyl deacetylase
MTIIAIGAHPDDPEEGMGGTLARIKKLDHEISDEKLIIVYMTSGGAGIGGKSQQDAITIREAEARAACDILHATPLFFPQIDGKCFPTPESIQKLADLFEQEEPRMIFTCWPLDTHPDHRATAFMVITAYGQVYGNSFASALTDPLDERTDPLGIPPLFFWATETWAQTLAFYPNHIVNIEKVIDIKMELIEAHASQNKGDKLMHWVELMAKMTAEPSAKTKYAEGFMRMRPPLL